MFRSEHTFVLLLAVFLFIRDKKAEAYQVLVE